MNNYTLFSVTSLNVSTQRVLFLKQQIKTTASISFCFIHSFFSQKTKRAVQDQKTLQLLKTIYSIPFSNTQERIESPTLR